MPNHVHMIAVPTTVESPVGWAKRAFFCEHAHADFAFVRGHRKRAHPTWLMQHIKSGSWTMELGFRNLQYQIVKA